MQVFYVPIAMRDKMFADPSILVLFKPCSWRASLVCQTGIQLWHVMAAKVKLTDAVAGKARTVIVTSSTTPRGKGHVGCTCWAGTHCKWMGLCRQPVAVTLRNRRRRRNRQPQWFWVGIMKINEMQRRRRRRSRAETLMEVVPPKTFRSCPAWKTPR